MSSFARTVMTCFPAKPCKCSVCDGSPVCANYNNKNQLLTKELCSRNADVWSCSGVLTFSSGVLHTRTRIWRQTRGMYSINCTLYVYLWCGKLCFITNYSKQTWRFTTSLYIATAVGVEWLSTSGPVYLAANRHCHNINDGVYYWVRRFSKLRFGRSLRWAGADRGNWVRWLLLQQETDRFYSVWQDTSKVQ